MTSPNRFPPRFDLLGVAEIQPAASAAQGRNLRSFGAVLASSLGEELLPQMGTDGRR
jgi:hypothetical protein